MAEKEREQSMHDVAIVLTDMDRGRFLAECNKAFTDMLVYTRDYAMDNKRKARARLRIDLNVGADDDGLIKLEGKVDVKQPDPLRGQDSYFLTRTGGLTRQNPRQQELFNRGLREVSHDPSTGEVREPGAAAQGEKTT